MSRRALSLSKSKLQVSPSKELTQNISLKCPKLSETKNSSSHSTISFVTSLKEKLKEKYNSTALGIKKISEIFPNEITAVQLKSILKEIKLKYTEKDFREFMRVYGKANKNSGFVGISIDNLSKCVKPQGSILSSRSNSTKNKSTKRISLIKTQSFSTRSSSNVLEETNNKFNSTLPQNHIPFDVALPKSSDKKVFLGHLLEFFQNPELTIDYFFYDRNESIDYEEFFESISRLGIQNIYTENKKIFEKMSQFKKNLEKSEFYAELFNFQCCENQENLKVLQEIRGKIGKTFGNYIKAFEEISCGGSFISMISLENIIKKLNILLEKDQFSGIFQRFFPNGKMFFKDFKQFWTGKDGICLIKSCEDSASENKLYCKKHFECILLKGEEVHEKLKTILKKDQLAQILQKVTSEKITGGLSVNGIELDKRELQALRESLKIKSENKHKHSSSVKNRV